jgi:hypothetical protein
LSLINQNGQILQGNPDFFQEILATESNPRQLWEIGNSVEFPLLFLSRATGLTQHETRAAGYDLCNFY